jgi:hypothetical protein
MKEEEAIFAPALALVITFGSHRLVFLFVICSASTSSIRNDASRRTIPPSRGQSSPSSSQTSERYLAASLGFEFVACRTATESSTVVTSPPVLLLWLPRSNALQWPILSRTMHLCVMGVTPEQLCHPSFAGFLPFLLAFDPHAATRCKRGY